MRHISKETVALFLASCAYLTSANNAQAYTIESAISYGCHERITMRALDRAYARGVLHREAGMSKYDRGLLNELPFELERPEHALFSTVAVALANRNVDIKGYSPNDLSTLALIHGDEKDQGQHCIRLPQDDGAEGSRAALQRCREIIRGHIDQAAQGLKANGRVNLHDRKGIHMYLEFSKRSQLQIPVFYLYLGRALHTLQDGFSHTIRTPDQLKVRSVTNYIDTQEGEHKPHRDGIAHIGGMDKCFELEPFQIERIKAATRASAELIAIATDPDKKGRDRKLDALFDKYLAYAPGCDVDRPGMCGAPELNIKSEDCSVSRRHGPLTLSLFFCIALSWLAFRRRCSAKSALLAVALLLCAPSVSLGQEFGGLARVGGSLDKGALSFAAGPVLEADRDWIIGLTVDFNPWIAFGNSGIRPGSLNLSVSLTRRFRVADDFAVRTGGALGISILLFDLAGAEQWDVGPYVEISPLSAEIFLGDDTSLLLDPSNIAVPIPHLSGIPVTYPQYRWNVGLQAFGREK